MHYKDAEKLLGKHKFFSQALKLCRELNEAELWRAFYDQAFDHKQNTTEIIGVARKIRRKAGWEEAVNRLRRHGLFFRLTEDQAKYIAKHLPQQEADLLWRYWSEDNKQEYYSELLWRYQKLFLSYGENFSKWTFLQQFKEVDVRTLLLDYYCRRIVDGTPIQEVLLAVTRMKWVNQHSLSYVVEMLAHEVSILNKDNT